MANGNSGKPKNVRKAQSAGATATAAILTQAAKPAAAKVAEAVAKAVEAPAKKPEPARAAQPAAAVQPAVLKQPAPAAAAKPLPVEAAKPAPTKPAIEASKPAPVEAAKPAPVAAAKPAPVEAPKPAPVQAAKPAPVQAVPAKPEPVEAVKPAPVQAAPAKPIPAPVADKIVEAPKVAAPATAALNSAQTVQNNFKTTTINATQTGAKIMNETINRTQEATQQVAQQATEQFRGAMSDVNQRSQAAMDKSARIVEEMADLGRGNMEAFVASSKTAAKYVETLTQGAADYNRRSFEQASATLRSFAEVKSPTDFFRLQSDYARNAFDSMVSESARVSETMVKMTGEIAEPITSRYSVAAERLKTVAA